MKDNVHRRCKRAIILEFNSVHVSRMTFLKQNFLGCGCEGMCSRACMRACVHKWARAGVSGRGHVCKRGCMSGCKPLSQTKIFKKTLPKKKTYHGKQPHHWSVGEWACARECVCVCLRVSRQARVGAREHCALWPPMHQGMGITYVLRA